MDYPEKANVTLAILRIPHAGLMRLKYLSRLFDAHKTPVPEELRQMVARFLTLAVLEQLETPLIANYPIGWGDWGCIATKHGLAIAECVDSGYMITFWTSTGSPVYKKKVTFHREDQTHTGTTFFVGDSSDDSLFTVSYCEVKHVLQIMRISLDRDMNDYEKVILRRWEAARHHPIIAVKKCQRFIFIISCESEYTLSWIDPSAAGETRSVVTLDGDMPKAFDVRMDHEKEEYQIAVLSVMTHFTITLSKNGSIVKRDQFNLEGFQDVVRASFAHLSNDLICIHRERSSIFPGSSGLRLARLCPGEVIDLHSMVSSGHVLKIIRRSDTSVFVISFKYN